MARIDEFIKKLLPFEGGYCNRQNDRGGATNFGITESVARAHGYTGDMRAIPVEIVTQIYYTDYYKRIGLSNISSDELAFELFEMGVNQGVSSAIKAFQTASNIISNTNLVIDGVLGDKTINAMISINTKNIKKYIKIINIIQGQRYIDICLKNPSQRVFLSGWLRRVL